VETLLRIGLSNAVAAAVLSLGAAAAARLLGRPPLTRALWLLVLLKLVTPPIWTIPVPLPIGASAHAPPTSAAPAKAPGHLLVRPGLRSANVAERVIDDPPSDVIQEVARAQTRATVVSPARDSERKPGRRSQIEQHWPLLAATFWLGGSGAYLLLVVRSAKRLRRLVGESHPAPRDVTRRCAALADGLGLRRPPEVRFLDSALTPMLCAIARCPRVLVPAGLWEKLTDGQRDSILAHELAHLRRRDHWVRLFELLVSVVYWWLPVVWWARRELREATEQCCDAWVLWTLPRSSTNYATALIEAIDYLSMAPAAVPLLASGMGQFTDLKRRLVMINRGKVRRALSWPAFAGVCVAAALLLPFSPTLGQTAVSVGQPQSETGDSPAVSGATTATLGERPVQLTVPSNNDNTAQQQPDRARIEAARADVQELRAKLEAAEARLALLEHGDHTVTRELDLTYGRAGTGGGAYVRTAPEGLPSTSNKVYAGEGRFGGGTGFGGGAGYAAGSRSVPENLASGSAEYRLDLLEQQLRQMQHELHQIRQQIHPDRPSALQAK